MIYVYGDDGSDEKHERVTAVAVIAGREEWWAEMEQQWIARCEGIPFHATDCESNHGDYKDIPHSDTKEMYRDLATILANSKLGGIGIAIDLQAQKEVLPGALALAYYRAFAECLERAANVAENLGEVAEITFDVSTENEHNADLLYSVARNGDARLRDWLHPKISFVHWKKSARVQTADLLAFEAWKSLDHTVGPIKRTRRSWDLLRNTGRFASFSYSYQWFRDFKVDLATGEPAKKIGFQESDYLAWLEKTGRIHSISNLFHFLDWIRATKESSE